ncbi:AP-5 complex subunit zeta-1 [Lingula anatina]|uniref:AP-5 complex subunit zeta-1 n=1 Tax=Lingula anatina TaxID=7574 RepID=A0A1S3K104_LINAN|nr:AP-5 complex subunit zeta-1 [Lingula anatina]|eukprot:XP_013416069.1 AP-5 complex subunit zeta-1 [Lingula anatina]
MSASIIENVLKQSRGYSQHDLNDFCGRIQTNTVADINGEGFIQKMRQLYLLLHCTRYRRSIPQELINKLVKILTDTEECSWRSRVICVAVLAELTPCEEIKIFDFNTGSKNVQLAQSLQVIASQGPTLGDFGQIIPLMVRWISTVGFDHDTQIRALLFINHIAALHQQLLTEDQVHVVSSQIADWLAHASVTQSPDPRSRHLFKKEEELMTELDGTPSKDQFTVLSLGKYYSSDQMLNIHSFSVLHTWLKNTSRAGLFVTSDTSSAEDLDSSMTDVSSKHILIEKSLDYCFRLLDQCERRVKQPKDLSLQEGVLIEVLSVLDCICQLKPGHVTRVFTYAQRLYDRIANDAAQARVVLQIIQLFLNHGDIAGFNSDSALEHYFGTILAVSFKHPAVAFDTVLFIRENLEILCYKTDVLSKFCPNILKILAWNPRSYLTEFIDILPAMITPSTALEIVHTLLDLACMTAAIESSGKMEARDRESMEMPSVALERLKEVKNSLQYKPYFSFILRNESGHGDTISKLGDLHAVLKDMMQSPRVLVCLQVVPVLLKVYFKTVLSLGDFELCSQLLPVLLERVGVLYGIDQYRNDIKKIFAEQLQALVKKHPQLVLEQHPEILEYVGQIRNITDKEDFFIHLVWVVGEYTSATYDPRCTPELVSKTYETLETLLYELSGLMSAVASENEAPYSVRLLTVMMSAVAKLASRCQDLIPRVLLCLTKVGQQHRDGNLEEESKQVLLARASELINLLKLPNVAPVILSPSAELETGKWHTENTSLPVLLRASNGILQNIL